MDWNDPRRALPEAPEENQQASEPIMELRRIILEISRAMDLRSTKARIAMDTDLNVKEITIEGFVV